MSKKRLNPSFLILLLSFFAGNAWSANEPTLATEAAAPKHAPPQLVVNPDTQGFYPLWENTGLVQPANQLFLATTGVQYGFENNGHVGVMPMSYMYRTPNVYLKYRLLTDPGRRWQVSLQGNFYYVMKGAAKAMFSPVYVSRLDNSDFSFTMVPVALSGTVLLKDWFLLHTTLTELGLFGEGTQNNFETGLTAVSEFRVLDTQSLLFHLGEVGFWRHDFLYTGASYRYHSNGGFELRFGYFYRFYALGSQQGPQLGLGLEL